MTVRTAGMFFVLMLAASAGYAAELGRMFYTPVQRATLDAARKQNIRTEISNDNSEQPVAAAPAAPLPQNVSVNGVIQRSDGKNTIWLNNRIVGDRPVSGMNATVGKGDNRVRLSVPDSGRKVEVKVGQTVEILSGAVDESYARRPAAKLEAKGAGNENSAVDAPKGAPPLPAEPLKSERAVLGQRRSSSTLDRDAADGQRINSGSVTK